MKPSPLPLDVRRVIPPSPGAVLRDLAVPGACVALAAAGACAAWWLTGLPWPSAAIAAAGLGAAGWRVSRTVFLLRADLLSAEGDRAALEESLRQSQRMEALGRLSVGIAHDFNNHLTVISSNVELLKHRLDGGQDRLRRHADAALAGVQRAAALTGRLLSFARQPAAEPEQVDIGRLLTGISELLRRTLGEGTGLAVEQPADIWSTWADVNQVENALLSLAVNVRERMRDGGAMVVAATNVGLDAAFARAHPSVLPGDYVRIVIAPKPFAAGDPGARWQPADDPGSADLAMARAFVRNAGGILLRSDPAEAALALLLFLPRYVPPAAGLAPRHRRTDGRATILVVEDDEAVRRTCVEALSELDYEVLDAPDAMEAFRLIADHGGIDLLLTDLGLPGGVSGRALADAARNVDRGIRVLFTTGYERADLAGLGADTMLRKPFSSAQLLQKVADALREQVATSEAIG